MKKIMFNDRYGLTDAVIEGRKTMTRRIIIPQPDFLSDNFGWAKRNNGDVILPKYGVNEVVAVAQIYEAAGFDPEYSIEGMLYAKKHAGWRNKMFVSAKYMPHQIRITGIRCERLQDISDDDCMKEGVLEHPYRGYMVDGILYKNSKDKEYNGSLQIFDTPRQAFAALIDKVSGRGTWKSNPWVVVYEFELVK